MSRMQGQEMAQVKEFMDRWVAAVLSGEVKTLDQMSAEDFVTIGPRGFVLNKQQWLGSFMSGDLKYESLKWDEVSIWNYGEAAIVTGRDRHTVKYQNRPMDFDLRGQLVLVKLQGDWKLASQQYSPIVNAPNE